MESPKGLAVEGSSVIKEKKKGICAGGEFFGSRSLREIMGRKNKDGSFMKCEKGMGSLLGETL